MYKHTHTHRVKSLTESRGRKPTQYVSLELCVTLPPKSQSLTGSFEHSIS